MFTLHTAHSHITSSSIPSVRFTCGIMLAHGSREASPTRSVRSPSESVSTQDEQPKKRQRTSGSRLSRLLGGIDQGSIIESTHPPHSSSKRAVTRQARHGRSAANYDQKLHPVDKVINPKHYIKRTSLLGTETKQERRKAVRSESETDDDDDASGPLWVNSGDSEHETDAELPTSQSASPEIPPSYREPDERATRRSTRPAASIYHEYRRTVHPQDNVLLGRRLGRSRRRARKSLTAARHSKQRRVMMDQDENEREPAVQNPNHDLDGDDPAIVHGSADIVSPRNNDIDVQNPNTGAHAHATRSRSHSASSHSTAAEHHTSQSPRALSQSNQQRHTGAMYALPSHGSAETGNPDLDAQVEAFYDAFIQEPPASPSSSGSVSPHALPYSGGVSLSDIEGHVNSSLGHQDLPSQSDARLIVSPYAEADHDFPTDTHFTEHLFRPSDSDNMTDAPGVMQGRWIEEDMPDDRLDEERHSEEVQDDVTTIDSRRSSSLPAASSQRASSQVL